MKDYMEIALTRHAVVFFQDASGIKLALSGTLLIVFCALYWQSSSKSSPKLDARFQAIKKAPFNVAFIGHMWAFLWDPDRFLRSNRDTAPYGIFALSMFGVNTNIIHSPSLMKQFFAQPNSVVEHKTLGASISAKIFGFPVVETDLLLKYFDELMNTITNNLMKGPGLEHLWNRLQEDIERQVPNMLSRSADPSRQHPWERVSNTIVRPDGTVEASLFPLIRNCVGSMSSRVMMGSDFYDSHPGLLEDIWKIDANIMGFIFGFPSFFPGMGAAYHARDGLLKRMTEWHRAMEEETLESPRFEDVSDLMKARQRVYSAHGFSLVARASIDMSILWALNANSNSITYWMVRNIHANGNLLSRVRAETAPFLSQNPSSNAKPSINLDGLMNHSPLFKSCYWESLRVDSGPWSFKRLQKDCVVQETPEDSRGLAIQRTPSQPTSFSLKQGDCVLIPADLHHSDPKYWANPSQFLPERFIVYKDTTSEANANKTTTTTTPQVTAVSEIKTVRPYGGGATMCKGRVLAEREVLSFVATFLQSWDLEPVGPSSQGWKFMGRQKTSGVTSPKGDLRVVLTRREGTRVV